MLSIRLVVDPAVGDTLVLPVRPTEGPVQPADGATQPADGATQPAEGPVHSAGEAAGTLVPTWLDLPAELTAEATALLPYLDQPGAAGAVHRSIRPLLTPTRLLLAGVGDGDEAGWRSAGAGVARAAAHESSITIAMPVDADPAVVRGLAEGLWLASYRFRMAASDDGPAGPPALAEVLLAVADPEPYRAALDTARAVAESTRFARDLTNTPSSRKTPAWFADQVVAAAAGHAGLTVDVREPDRLTAEGFGGILAVGGGSAQEPRLVELSWQPADARTHVVLVGKGITFDTGGISIKPRDAMKLMRKDMGGAAAVIAATVGAAALGLPVRVTALAPLAENMASGSAYRPGDVVRHYGGLTSESTNTDAEGRLVLADALAYAVDRLEPDLLIDLATLTGANSVALGKRTAALYSDNDELADAVLAAAGAAGERAWRMPLPVDYTEYLGSEIADLYSAPTQGAGSVVAALYLREFTGDLRDRWLHLDMSAPSWADGNDGELVKGATGWGVRTLLRWLATQPG
ncbi:leucyl aminopeptidase family protein [Plantactinospora sp. S1510]|uniref:Probable cytosol aminopeptidase n=1 Tax=Plantactinospora alkalitolerans TaxID=2789879 RepID=A0ABS0GR14_9ACTN|nr:leucyl aminopeptidase family protein [Plantactinospora alkalitolerans]MBF9128627.1 leucyl aminopeptidase family protein [Plantactinospora alkalitolerans]